MNDELSAPKLTKLAETIGFEITEFTPGKCIVELTIREDHLNAGGVAHGGLHATLLDTAMGGDIGDYFTQRRVVCYSTIGSIISRTSLRWFSSYCGWRSSPQRPKFSPFTR